MIRRVAIQTLAPTGEGVARTADGVGFVAGALPGEEVEAEVLETHRRFWKGRVAAVLVASPDRLTGGHAGGCAGCDWAALPLALAREWKRSLFRETMARIGELPPESFGDLPIAPSPPGYRLRTRFHVEGRGPGAAVGYFAPRTHRVEPAHACLALGENLRALLPEIAAAVADSGAAATEMATAESLDGSSRLARARLAVGEDRRAANALASALAPLFDGIVVADAAGHVLASSGESRLWVTVRGRAFPITPAAFFQSNRFLLDELSGDASRAAAGVPSGTALDAFGGVGLFAGALLDAGHSVTSVEGDHEAAALASEARGRSRTPPSWTIARASVLAYLESHEEAFDAIVVDPPRAGLGLRLSAVVARRTRGVLHYVSCDPATLARDLAVLVSEGLAIREAKLYDLFAWTHRVEAAVTLERTVAR